jgi:hypothetical protein
LFAPKSVYVSAATQSFIAATVSLALTVQRANGAAIAVSLLVNMAASSAYFLATDPFVPEFTAAVAVTFTARVAVLR